MFRVHGHPHFFPVDDAVRVYFFCLRALPLTNQPANTPPITALLAMLQIDEGMALTGCVRRRMEKEKCNNFLN